MPYQHSRGSEIPDVREMYPDALDELCNKAAQDRAAFSWDDVTFEDVACGYISERGATTLRIPDKLHGLVIPYCYGVDPVRPSGDAFRLTNRKAPAQSSDYSFTPLFTSTGTVEKMSDHDLLIAHAITGALTHSSTSQIEAVMKQPDWLTFMMNHGTIASMARQGIRNWKVDSTSAFEASASLSAKVTLMEKGLRGALDWIEAHGDLVFKAPVLYSEAGIIDFVVEELEDAMAQESYHDRPDNVFIQNWIQQHKGMDGRLGATGHPLTNFWALIRHVVERYVRMTSRKTVVDIGREDRWKEFVETVEKLDGHTIARKWLLRFFDRMQDAGVVSINYKSQFVNKAGLRYGHPRSWLAPQRFAHALQTLMGSTEMSWDNVLEYARSHARELIERKLDSDYVVQWYDLADAACQITTFAGCVLSGGELQQLETGRYARAGWPHICNKWPDDREPRITEHFGQVMVYGLETKREDRFEVPIKDVKNLCDENGEFLPYDEAVAVLKKLYNDFDGTTKELDEFIAELKEEYEDEPWVAHFEEFIRCGFKSEQIQRMCDFEVETDKWWPLLKDSENIDDRGKEPYANTSGGEEHAVAFKFTIGHEVMEAVYLDPSDGFTPDENVRRAAAGYVFNGYSDVGKMCWLSYRGVIGKEDEVYSKGWNPFVDLKPNMARDYVDWCFEVPDVDGWQHELSRYDGKGWIYEPPPRSNGETADSGKHEMVPQGWGFAYYREN